MGCTSPSWRAGSLGLIALSALAAAAGLAATLPSGTRNITNLSVSAIVRPATLLRFEGGSVELRVSAADITRGYVDVPAQAQLTIVSGKDVRGVVNVTVDFEPHPEVFRSIQVSARPNGNGNAGNGNGGNGNGHKGSDPANVSSTSLAYRLFLAGKAKTGNFSVPLTLSVQL